MLELGDPTPAPEGKVLPFPSPPPPPDPVKPVDASMIAKYRAVLHQIEIELSNGGSCVAELRERECRHDHVLISETTTAILCKVCGGEIEVWWWARRLAREWGRLAGWVDHRRKERIELERQIVDLKRQVANLTAQVKRRGGHPAGRR